MTKILSGPYGSLSHDILTAEGVSKQDRALILHPEAILHDPRTQRLETSIAKGYAGKADILSSNTFGTRHLIKGDLPIYREAFLAHAQIPDQVSKGKHEIACSFGPFGDCYDIGTIPKTIAEGVDFWEDALSVLERIALLGKQFRYVLSETVKSSIEGIAFAIAWNRLPRNLQRRFQPVLSFIPDHRNGLLIRSQERLDKAVRDTRAICSDILFGLNCCPLLVLEKAVKSVHEQIKVPISFLYPNASDKDPLELEKSTENEVSREPDTVGQALQQILKRLESLFPDHEFVVNECCGGTPERTGVIRARVFSGVQVS